MLTSIIATRLFNLTFRNQRAQTSKHSNQTRRNRLSTRFHSKMSDAQRIYIHFATVIFWQSILELGRLMCPVVLIAPCHCVLMFTLI